MQSMKRKTRKITRFSPERRFRYCKVCSTRFLTIDGYGLGSTLTCSQECINKLVASLKVTEAARVKTCLQCLTDCPVDESAFELEKKFVCNYCERQNRRLLEMELTAAYYRQLRIATPVWSDRKAIALIYEEARKLSRETGIQHHVDHIYPLRSPLVSGLHVAANLRIITASENCSKGNRMPVF